MPDENTESWTVRKPVSGGKYGLPVAQQLSFFLCILE